MKFSTIFLAWIVLELAVLIGLGFRLVHGLDILVGIAHQ